MQNRGALSGRHERQEVAGGPSRSGTSSPDNCHLLVHPCRNPPFPTITTKGREGDRYLLSDLSGSTVTSVQLPGKSSFNKLHLNQLFPLINHNKQHFGKSRHFLLWKNKSLVLQDSNLLLVVLCSDFMLASHHQAWSHQHFGGCGTFGRALVTAGDRTPIWMELGSYTVWPFLHK